MEIEKSMSNQNFCPEKLSGWRNHSKGWRTQRKEQGWEREGLFGPAVFEVSLDIKMEISSRQLAIPV